MQIDDKADLYPPSLSAPDWQKTALARVIAAEAKILLLDEPLGALDQKIREEFQVFLRNLVKKEHLTAIHVTHDQSEALTISDKVAVMNKGQLIQLGSPTNLIFTPNHLFTSFFVGESDFLETVVMDDKDTNATVRVGKSLIKVKNMGIEKGKRAIVAVRREFFEIYKMDDKNDVENYLPGIVVRDQFLGLLRRVSVKLENQQIVEVKIHAKHPVRFKENEKVKLAIDPSSTRCFEYPAEGISAALEM